MSNKTRQLVTIIGLVVLLLVMGIGYYAATAWQQKKADKESENAQDEITLYSMDKEKVNKLHLVTTELDVTYVKKNDVWQDSSDTEFPVNQEMIAEMLEDVAEVNATKLVADNPDDISQYQLDKPLYQVELEDEEGNTHSLDIGMESVAAEGYYVRMGDDSKVYVIASSKTSSLMVTKNEMMVLPESPDITADYVTAFKVTPAKGTAFEAVYNDKNAVYKDYEGWDIKYAYKQTMPGSASALQTLFSTLAGLSYSDGVAYKTTKQLNKQYGLDKPAYTLEVSYYTVEQTEETESAATEETEEKRTEHFYKLSVGAKDDLEENYYVSVQGEEGIYRIPADTIESLVNITPFDMLCKTPYKANVDTLQKIVLIQNGKSHTITMKKEEVKNAISEDNKPVYNYFVQLDGKDVEDEPFRAAYYNVFDALVYRGTIDASDKKAAGSKAEQTVKIITDDRQLTLEFLPWDGVNFYRIRVDGNCLFTVDKNVADKIFTKLLASK